MEAKVISFFGFMTFALCLFLGIAAFINKALGHLTDFKVAEIQANAAVAIAKLQAQENITVACMQNSWFTSMTECIRAGGVNGPGGLSWGMWAAIIAVSILITWAIMRYRGDE